MAISPITIVQTVSNADRNLVFFPGGESSQDDSWLCFNYKTGQWTEIPAYEGIELFSVKNKGRDIGLIRYSGGAVDLQAQNIFTYPEQDAVLTTGARDINQGGRVVINGVRPLHNGGTATVRIGVQDDISDNVTWVTGAAVNSRTGYANLRAEGRYVRAEVTTTGDLNTFLGADVEWSPAGRV